MNQDYKQNRQKYESFIKERTREDNPNKEERERWKRYLTEKGNVSKRGYQEYKNFINFVRNIDEVMSTYGYETIKDFYYDEADPEEQKVIEDLLIETYDENLGEGLTPSELIDIFNEKLADHKKEKNRQIAAAQMKKKQANKKAKAPEIKAKYKNRGSSTEIKVKKAGKLRSGRIQNKKTT